MIDEAARQRIRVQRFGLAAGVFGVWAGFMLFADTLGMYHLEVAGVELSVWVLIAGMVIGNLLFFVLFVTGLNLRFADPSLTMPMMLVALVWAFMTTGGLGEHRALGFSAFIVVFMFGVFNLRVMQYALIWVFAMAGYALAVYLTLPDDPSDAQLRHEWLQFALLAALLFWVAFFGGYVGRLRDALRARNAELGQALALVEELAVRDDLTGLHNRRFVMDALKRELQRADRHGTPFSILVLDIDRFKEINDGHGHLVGDEVLKGFVTRLNQAIRGVDVVGAGKEPGETDTIGRFGGEEFIVILPHTQLEGAQRVGERVRLAACEAPFETSAGAVGVTVSIGIAEYRRGETARSILERVDNAMYAAKHGGRNRMAVAPVDDDGTPMLYAPEES